MCGGIHRRIEADNGAGEGPARQGVGGQADLVAALDAGVVGLGNGDQELDRSDLLDGVDGLGHGVEVAAVVVAGRHDAAHGRAQDRVLQQVLVAALRHLESKFERLEVRLGHAAFLEELLHAGEFGLVVLEAEGRLVELDAVHLGEDLAGRHEVADLDVEFLDAAARLRGDVVDHVGLDGGGVDRLLGDRLPGGGGDGHDRGLVRHARHRIGGHAGFLLAAGAQQRAAGHSYQNLLIHCHTFYSVGHCPRRR